MLCLGTSSRQGKIPITFRAHVEESGSFDRDVINNCSLFPQDSPSNKLLYAREIPGYRQEVERSVNNLVG